MISSLFFSVIIFFLVIFLIFCLVTEILPVIVTDHAHIFGIAAPIRVLTSRSSLRSSKLMIALLTKAFRIVFSANMRASRYVHKGLTNMLLINL